jgi:hypothetical protein
MPSKPRRKGRAGKVQRGKGRKSRRTSSWLAVVIKLSPVLLPVFMQVNEVLHSWLGGSGGPTVR